MGVRTYESRDEPRRRRGPSAWSAVLVGGVVLIGLLANGRPIGDGDAPGLPFLSAAAAAPFLAVARLAFVLDATGAALAGKLAASLFCAVAAALLFSAVARRRPTDEAWAASLLFAFGTTLWAAAQSLSATPVATALVAAALLLLVKAEDEPDWAPRSGLPLALAVAANPADLALAVVLAVGTALRRPRQIGLWALWSLPGIALALGAGVVRGGSSLRALSGEGWAERLVAELVSPAMGLLVFAPVVVVALVGLARAGRREGLPLALACALSFLAHGLFIAAIPIRGGSWGPRGFTDALPLVLLFLPQGFDVLKTAGTALAVISVAIQALGAFSYDLRSDRLYARSPDGPSASVWDAARSPIPFHIGERVLILALPQVHEGRAQVREHRIVLFSPTGSRLSADGSRLVIEGSDLTFGDVHLQGGAAVRAGRIRLEGAGDAVFLRLRPENRSRRLELRIAGRGQGTLTVGEATFWSRDPRVRERAVAGDFRIKLPYHYPDSGGDELTVALRSGSVAIASIGLVPPTEPENVIRLGPSPDP